MRTEDRYVNLFVGILHDLLIKFKHRKSKVSNLLLYLVEPGVPDVVDALHHGWADDITSNLMVVSRLGLVSSTSSTQGLTKSLLHHTSQGPS
ncbi:hypothetical protein J6590_021745 [Homalodisca vitripennis]|nr:hypothetical protein J6590_021745 [Homalodisca vitripennis]